MTFARTLLFLPALALAQPHGLFLVQGESLDDGNTTDSLAVIHGRAAMDGALPWDGFRYAAGAAWNGTVTRDTPGSAYDALLDQKGTLQNLSLDYFGSRYALSAGRHALSLPWLSGSFDGLLAYGVYDGWEGRLFYFNRYETLLPTYYAAYDDLGERGGLYGGEWYATDWTDWEAGFYLFREAGLFQVAGGGAAFWWPGVEANLHTVAYSGEDTEDESTSRFSLAAKAGKGVTLEGGLLLTGEAGVTNLFRFGDSDGNRFGMEHLYYLPDATELYGAATFRLGGALLKATLGTVSYAETVRKRGTATETGLWGRGDLGGGWSLEGELYLRRAERSATLVSDLTFAVLRLGRRF